LDKGLLNSIIFTYRNSREGKEVLE